jgi:hypothetical protein
MYSPVASRSTVAYHRRFGGDGAPAGDFHSTVVFGTTGALAAADEFDPVMRVDAQMAAQPARVDVTEVTGGASSQVRRITWSFDQ